MLRAVRSRLSLPGFALLNAIRDSALLPLWEGFDEPFHFGYVQWIANGGGLPDAQTAVCPQKSSRRSRESGRATDIPESARRNTPDPPELIDLAIRTVNRSA